MEPLELGNGGKTHVQAAIVLLNTLESDGLEFGFDIVGELSRHWFR
jgi:hypothetical protein